MFFLRADEKGKICGWRTICDEEHLALYRDVEGERLISAEKEYPAETHYITESDEIRERPRMTLTVSGVFISGIPAPCTCRINGFPYEIEDAEIEFETPVAGTYKLEFEKWPYRTEVVTIEIAPRSD